MRPMVIHGAPPQDSSMEYFEMCNSLTLYILYISCLDVLLNPTRVACMNPAEIHEDPPLYSSRCACCISAPRVLPLFLPLQTRQHIAALTREIPKLAPAPIPIALPDLFPEKSVYS